MNTAVPLRDIMTPEQAAAYLQVNRETIYRYIKDGRLMASKLGRTYRIPRRNLELLLMATQARADLSPRVFSDEEIEAFLREDELDAEQRAAVERVVAGFGRSSET